MALVLRQLMVVCPADFRDKRDKYGWPPLHILARDADTNGVRPGMIRTLVTAQADPDVRKARGHTPLMTAVNTSHKAAATELLLQGADPYLQNDEHTTCLDMAWDNRKMLLWVASLGEGAGVSGTGRLWGDVCSATSQQSKGRERGGSHSQATGAEGPQHQIDDADAKGKEMTPAGNMSPHRFALKHRDCFGDKPDKPEPLSQEGVKDCLAILDEIQFEDMLSHGPDPSPNVHSPNFLHIWETTGRAQRLQETVFAIQAVTAKIKAEGSDVARSRSRSPSQDMIGTEGRWIEWDKTWNVKMKFEMDLILRMRVQDQVTWSECIWDESYCGTFADMKAQISERVYSLVSRQWETFYFGICHSPAVRWLGKQGFAESDVEYDGHHLEYDRMLILATAEAKVIGQLERYVIKFHKDGRCRNRSAGGERSGPIGTLSFLYVVYTDALL